MRLPGCCRRPATKSGGDRDVGQRGLFAEPRLDSSGYRRYRAEHATDLVKIKTLAEAGVPLARIKELLAADPDRFSAAIAEIGRNLQQRAEQLQCTGSGSRPPGPATRSAAAPTSRPVPLPPADPAAPRRPLAPGHPPHCRDHPAVGLRPLLTTTEWCCGMKPD